MENLKEKAQLASEVAIEIYEEIIDRLPDLLEDVPQEIYDGCLLLIGHRLSAHAIAAAIINSDMNAAISIHKMSSEEVMKTATAIAAGAIISRAMGEQDEGV